LQRGSPGSEAFRGGGGTRIRSISRPLVISIPHQFGKEEAVWRLKSGFGRARATFGEKLAVIEENWSGEHLDFRAGILGQTTSGMIDVAEDHVRVEVQLPWLLGTLAEQVRAFIERHGHLMLEKSAAGNRDSGTGKRDSGAGNRDRGN
jgi:Putative polyhydroxyalkanoic acid system protein (PHA_gran_rgn)